MYEMELLEPQFGLTFLNRIVGKNNSFDNLKQLDPELSRNLAQLKDIDVCDLGLTFSYAINELSITEEVDLIPNGRNTPVTNKNKISYIHQVANYLSNRQT